MNKDTFQGKWTEVKGEIQNLWGKLTHDDLDRTKGNLDAISGLVRQHYSDSKDDVAQKLKDAVHRVEHTVADKTEQAKTALRESENRHV